MSNPVQQEEKVKKVRKPPVPAAKAVLDEDFDQLADKIVAEREAEKRHADARITLEGELVNDFFGTKWGGSTTLKSAATRVKVEYPVYPKADAAAFKALSKDVGKEIFKQITKPKREFSQSGFSAVIKRLTEESITSHEAEKLLIKIKNAVEKHVQFDDGKPSVKVEKLPKK
jgi:hypothetical protein